MPIDTKIQADSEDDEAWLLFLKKFENLKLSPVPKTHKYIEENVIYGIFDTSNRSLRKPT